MNKGAIILLSGGLDSLVSAGIAVKKYKIKKALFFNYGQNAFEQELSAFNKICKHYSFEGEVIDLGWLGKISDSLLNSSSGAVSDSLKYWVPNRNGLFVNIGASFAEALDCDFVIIGANRTEAVEFIDNSKEFVQKSNDLFKYSTRNSVKLVAPLIKMSKEEIVKEALKIGAPLEFVWSCYYNGEKHCGKCPSCRLLKEALTENAREDLKNLLF